MVDGQSSPLLGRALAHAMGDAAVHLLHVHVGGGKVVVVRGGTTLLCGQNVPGEAVEEAMMLLHMAGALGSGDLLLSGEALGRLESEVECLRVLVTKAPGFGLRHGQRLLYHLAEECLLRVNGDRVPVY